MKAKEFIEAYNEAENRFKVNEYSSYFAVEDTVTGEEASMGDGVDTLSDEEGNALSPGTPGFIERWEEDLNINPSETLEAYFPEQYEKENESVDVTPEDEKQARMEISQAETEEEIKDVISRWGTALYRKLKNESLLEWHCPKCDNDEIPDGDRECLNCGFMVPKEMNDRIREVYGKIYDKVFSKIRSKLLEDEIQGTNTIKFVNTLSRIGVIRRLRSGRYEEAYKIPKEFVISAFIEGKSGLPRLRRMVLRRQKGR